MGSKMKPEVRGRRQRNSALARLELGKGEMFRTGGSQRREWVKDGTGGSVCGM